MPSAPPLCPVSAPPSPSLCAPRTVPPRARRHAQPWPTAPTRALTGLCGRAPAPPREAMTSPSAPPDSRLLRPLPPRARCPLQRPNPPPLVSVLPASNTASPEPGPATAPLPLPCVRSCTGGRWPEPLTGGALPLVNQKEEKKKGKRRKMKMKMKMKLVKEIMN